jgi:WD40 repeat protein
MRYLAALALLALPAAAPAAAPFVPLAAAVAALIDQLGDDDADVRNQAEKKLEALGEDAVPALLAASKKHPDIDVRLRVMVVARAIRANNWGLLEAIGPGAALKEHPFGGGYWLNRVRFSKDGKYAIAAGGALILYEIATGKEVGRVLEVARARTGLDLSADGKLALTSHSEAPDFHLVEVPSLKTKQTFKGHKGGVSCVALSADSTRAVSVGTDRTVRLWDVEKGKELGQITDLGVVTRAAFSPDGKRVLVGLLGKDNEELLRLFDAESRKQLGAYKGHKGATSGIAFLPGGKSAVACDTAGQVIVWDLESGKKLKEMSHGALINDLALSPDGRRAVTAGFGDNKVKVWELQTGKLLESFEGHVGAVLGVGFSSDGRRAISSDTVCCVRTWKTGK